MSMHIKEKNTFAFSKVEISKITNDMLESTLFYFPFSHLSTAQCWTKWFN